MLIQAGLPVNHVRCDGQLIAHESIVWLEGDWNYTRIHRQNELTHLSAYTLKWYEQLLTSFVRVSKDAMVNPQHVQSVISLSSRPRRLQLILSNGEQIEVARRRQAETRRHFKALLVMNTKQVKPLFL